MKKNLYIVIDKIYGKNDGGLVAAYINLNELLKDTYTIHIISIFKYNYSDCFENNNKISIIDSDFDINFPKLLKNKHIFKAFQNAFRYFSSIHKARQKIKSILTDDDLVIVSSPSAAIFMPKIDFILEIHTNYTYFFKGFGIGRLQTLFMQKPAITIFRTQYDSAHAPRFLHPACIYNFFDNGNIEPNAVLVKNKLLFVGRLNKEKDPLRLVEIAEILRKTNDFFTLDIYGTGDLENELKKKIEEHSLQDFVHCKGFTTNKNVYKDYSALILTSKVEGFGLVIIEAKANGIPAISTDWGNGVFEIINDGKDGYVAHTNEKLALCITHILTDAQLQKELGTNAYVDFIRFNKETAKEKWLTVLNTYKKSASAL